MADRWNDGREIAAGTLSNSDQCNDGRAIGSVMRYSRFGGRRLGLRHPAMSDMLSGYKSWFPGPENMGVGFGTVFLSGIPAE